MRDVYEISFVEKCADTGEVEDTWAYRFHNMDRCDRELGCLKNSDHVQRNPIHYVVTVWRESDNTILKLEEGVI